MVMAHPVSSGSKFSNESLLERLSCNIFITNFPTTMSAKELWNTCAKYGTLLDVYIPEKMSKMGKRFAFARYHKVYDVDMLIRNLRPSFAKVVKGSVIQQRNVAPVMVLERVVLKGKVSIVRAKEVMGWVPDFVDDNSNESEVGSDDNIVVIHNWVEEEDDEDPFGLEDLILKSSKKRNVKDVKESTVIPSNSDIPAKDGAKQVSEENEPKFPPGFTPSNSDLPHNNEKIVQDDAGDGKSDIESKNKSYGGAKQDHVDSMAQPTKPVNGFSILERFQEFISIGQAMGYGMNGCEKDY
ncbi:RNA-directed DNA polymerase, eukaryota [Tanacetum coccineum]